MKKYDLMNQINARGTFMASKYCLPYLKQSSNPHILNLSPPLVMKPFWFGNHLAYTMSKYGMSMCVLGLSDECKPYNIGVNALWPRTAIWTAAMGMLGGGEADTAKMCRKVEIMSDSAYAILRKDSKSCTGNFFIDEEVLRDEGIKDFTPYSIEPGRDLLADFFLPDHLMEGLSTGEIGKTSSQSSSPSSSEEVMKLFEAMQTKITDKIKDEINASLLFVISGQNYLFVSQSSSPLKISSVSEPPSTVDVTMITDEETFFKMAKNELKPTSAFMSGKLKIKGNMSLAMKVEKLFKAN